MNNRTQLLASIAKLRNTKFMTFAKVDASVLGDEQRLMEYFEAPFDSDVDRELEKIAATAAIRSTYSSKFIPNSWKNRIAQRQARQVVEMLRYAKLDYKYATSDIYADEYNRRLKQNNVAQKLAICKTAIKVGVKSGIRKGVGIVIRTVTTLMGCPLPKPAEKVVSWAVVKVAEVMIPQKVKEKIKGVLRNVTHNCVGMANVAIKAMTNTGKKACQKIAEKVAPVVEKAANTLKRVGEKVEEGWQSVKQGAKKMWNRLFG